MQSKPNISPNRLAQLRAESQQLRPHLKAERPADREDWTQWANRLTGVVARHSEEIDDYVQTHGLMTRQEVVEKALSNFLSEVWQFTHISVPPAVALGASVLATCENHWRAKPLASGTGVKRQKLHDRVRQIIQE